MHGTPGKAARAKRKRNFITAGIVKIPWYKSTDGRTLVDPRRYGRKVFTRANHDDALREAHLIAQEINSGGTEIQAFTAADRAIYAQASDTAESRGRELLAVTTDWAAAFDLIQAEADGQRPALIDVVRAGLAALRRPVHLTGDVLGELLNSKAASDLDGRYENDLKKQLREFVKSFPGDMALITTAQVEEWVNGRTHTVTQKPLSPKRRFHIRNYVITLFKFARARGYLPDRVTAAQQTPAVKVRRGNIDYFTPAEMAIVLKFAEEDEIPWFGIGGFSGVRIEELGKSKHAADRKDTLHWEDIDWKENEILVREEVAKTGVARRCPLLDNLREILLPFRNRRGPIIEGTIDAMRARLKRRFEKLAEKHPEEIAGRILNWPHNALRHSYGSYRMAIIKDMARLAYEMGDSPAVIKRHYHNPRAVSEAEAWFTLSTGGDKVVQMSWPTISDAAAGGNKA